MVWNVKFIFSEIHSFPFFFNENNNWISTNLPCIYIHCILLNTRKYLNKVVLTAVGIPFRLLLFSIFLWRIVSVMKTDGTSLEPSRFVWWSSTQQDGKSKKVWSAIMCAWRCSLFARTATWLVHAGARIASQHHHAIRSQFSNATKDYLYNLKNTYGNLQ